MRIAFPLPMTMLLWVPVTEFHLILFYPAFLVPLDPDICVRPKSLRFRKLRYPDKVRP
jgi:hypothetical protein